MKISRTTPKPTFNPLHLELTIETFEEYQTLLAMIQLDCSIPELVKENGGDYNQTVRFLGHLRRALAA